MAPTTQYARGGVVCPEEAVSVSPGKLTEGWIDNAMSGKTVSHQVYFFST